MTAAAFDYEKLRDDTIGPTVLRFGRALTLTRAARETTAAPLEPSKPWLSKAKGDADPDAAPAQSCTGTGVFLSLVRRDRDGQTVQLKTQGVIFVADEQLPEELGPEWKVTDGTDVWEAISSRPLKPGSTLLLYRLDLSL